jgi:protein TonB
MENMNALTPYVSTWDQPTQKANRRGFTIAVTSILALHAALGFYLYKSRIEPRYIQYADLPPVSAAIVHPAAPPPPPPPKRLNPVKTPAQAHPRIAALPPIDIQPPKIVTLPSTETHSDGVAPPPTDHTADPKPRIVISPQFDRRPTADDMAQYYPERAQRLGKEGAAAIRCTVSSKGALIGCTVLSEDPVDYGFGDAALKLAKLFKLKPATSDGVPVDGGIFSTRITFKIPE